MKKTKLQLLVVGSGGREHALAWKLAQSPRVGKIYAAPGNPGTAAFCENVSIAANDVPGLTQFAVQQGIDLVVVGPEIALEAGLVDSLQAAGIQAFGPTRLAARIETSKVFAKSLMQRHHIPTAVWASFDSFDPAWDYIQQAAFPLVLKASGLAAGKGVILPDTLAEARIALESMLVAGEFGIAGRQVVIEERLIGPEISLLAFSDGKNLALMPPAQDHKRLLDGNRGPNTGGMGAFAPAPLCHPAMAAELAQTVLQPALDALYAEGTPFVGILYAGLILTADGPRVLEYNCRFGDPETQALLPLLETDLVAVIQSCLQGRLKETTVEWKSGASACVILAVPGYPSQPQTGAEVTFTAELPQQSAVFHAGTKRQGDRLLTAGGRVLGVTAWDTDLPAALERAYQAVDCITFEGAQYRHDIGSAHLKGAGAYASAGVNIDAGNEAVRRMSAAVKSTYTPAVLAGIGAFGGLFDATRLKSMTSPVLVASTDGVGTKVKLAAALNGYASIGQDIVNHCIDDILVQGASPLFFLDYFATARLDPAVVAEIVGGMSQACRESNCVLLGGETAEMPGVYAAGEFDVAGTIVGLVERSAILPRPELCAGDLLVGLRSSGPHTNGYSLIRHIFADSDYMAFYPELNCTLADALLAPHRSYLPVLNPVLAHPERPIKALAHITGGGFIENIPRVLPDGLSAHLRWDSWPIPPLFSLIQQRGQVGWAEMARVFNLGIGMVAVINPEHLPLFQQLVGEETWVIGSLTYDTRRVVML